MRAYVKREFAANMFAKEGKISIYSLTGLGLSPLACLPQSSNLRKVPFKFAGSLCNNQIPTVPGKRYSIP
jgi:hypothetical protein